MLVAAFRTASKEPARMLKTTGLPTLITAMSSGIPACPVSFGAITVRGSSAGTVSASSTS